MVMMTRVYNDDHDQNNYVDDAFFDEFSGSTDVTEKQTNSNRAEVHLIGAILVGLSENKTSEDNPLTHSGAREKAE